MHSKYGIVSATTAAVSMLLSLFLVSCNGTSLRAQVSQAIELSSKELLEIAPQMYLPTCSNKPPKYTKVQYISFQISVRAKVSIENGQVKQGYHAIQEDDGIDMYKRLTIMKQAIDEASTSIVIDKDPTVLKIFSAPEFFFRGIDGTYDAMDAKEALVPDLFQMADEEKFEDWLFFFGSVVGKLRNQDHYYNVGVIVRGHGKDTWVQPKAFISGIDFLNATARPIANGGISIEEMRNTRGHLNSEINSLNAEFADSPYTIASAFETDGITFAVDICLDHLYGLAKQYQQGVCPFANTQVGCDPGVTCTNTGSTKTCQYKGKTSYNLRPPCQPMVQLIASAGMTIKPESIAVQTNGYVFLTDGLNPLKKGGNTKFHSEAKKNGADGLTNVSTLASVGLFGENWCNLIKNHFYTGLPIPGGECEAGARPYLAVYNTVPLPTTAARPT